MRRGSAHIRPVSAPSVQIAVATVTTPIAAKNAPAPAVPYPRVITTASTNPNKPLVAAPSSPATPLRALRRVSAEPPSPADDGVA